MTTSLEPDIVVLAADWPGGEHKGPRPGDLSQFAPQGLALAPPLIIRPYGGMADPSYYGAQGTITHPIRSAPVNDDTGGVIYFSDYVENDELMAALGIMGVRLTSKDYAVFTVESDEPGEDHYLEQMRVIGRGALAHFFAAPADALAEQTLDVGQACQRFIAWQKSKWDGSGGRSLHGCLGGDGDWAKERLAFGALVENAYWGIFRIWSRPWLVTK